MLTSICIALLVICCKSIPSTRSTTLPTEQSKYLILIYRKFIVDMDCMAQNLQLIFFESIDFIRAMNMPLHVGLAA